MNKEQEKALLKLVERVKENTNYAIMFVDGNYTLVDTENNSFDVIEWIEFID